MPVEHAGFAMHPVGFFDRSPVLDVQPEMHIHAHTYLAYVSVLDEKSCQKKEVLNLEPNRAKL
eukprot:8759-Heterococcus_DN1.PRE.3